MKHLYTIILSVLALETFSQNIVINEIDADQPANQSTGVNDSTEFIELYGSPNQSLDGLVLVLFNGANNLSYQAYDLTGFSTNAEGFFVIGTQYVPGSGIVIPSNTIQNGADAVALYAGSSADWNNSPPTTVGLLDALVYGTSDPTDQDLIDALHPGMTQVDENQNGNGQQVSISRLPDGGDPFASGQYVVQIPTPNASNGLLCPAHQIFYNGNITSATVTNNGLSAALQLNNNYSGENNYRYLLTDSQNNVLLVLPSNLLEADTLSAGTYRVFGVTYSGGPDNLNTPSGLSIDSISVSTGCFRLADSPLLLTVVQACNSGFIFSNDSLPSVGACIDAQADWVRLHVTASGTFMHTWIITDTLDIIVGSSQLDSIDINTLPAGKYFLRAIFYDGAPNPSTLQTGLPLGGVQQTGGACLTASTNIIIIETAVCPDYQPCSDLFFSAYLEGTGNNKAIAVFNPTPFPVQLNNYSVRRYSNGSWALSGIAGLNGVLQPLSSYVIVAPDADESLLATANDTSAVAIFNGNDALQLFNGNALIDVIGRRGENPGLSWLVPGGSTSDNLLIRKESINHGEQLWSLSQLEWEVLAWNNYDTLTDHSFISCNTTPIVGFLNSGILVEENAGTVTIPVVAYNVSSPFIVVVDGQLTGTAIDGEDYHIVLPDTLHFSPSLLVDSIQIEIIDDAIQENNTEYLTIRLITNDSTQWLDTLFTLSIAPSDRAYPFRTVASVHSNDPSGLADSLGITCELRGIVYGINFNAAGTHFTINDATGWLKVFDATDNHGYEVNEGDSVRVFGTIFQFDGQTQIKPDSILFVSANHQLVEPQLVSTLDETMESRLVSLHCTALLDPNEWQIAGGGFYARAQGVDGVIEIRFDGDANFFGDPFLDGRFNVTGIVEQFDETAPYNSGYSIWPRYIDDISNRLISSFNPINELVYSEAGGNYAPVNTSTGATNYEWLFGDGFSSNDMTPTHLYDYNWLNDNPLFIISLVVSNNAGCADTSSSLVLALYSGITELDSQIGEIYPNPVAETLNLSMNEEIDSFRIYSSSGQLLCSKKMSNSAKAGIDVSSYEQGMYVLIVETPHGLHRRAFTVVR
jgi:hypothetical protein